MNWTAQHRLTILEKLTARFDQVEFVDYVIPSNLEFVDKSDFWGVMKTFNPNLTQKKIETSLIRALWFSDIRFEVDDPEANHPVYTGILEVTVAHEYKYEKLDKNDSFKVRILKNGFEHACAVSSAVREFEGRVDLTGLENDFDILRTAGLTQTDYTRQMQFDFVPGVSGFQTKLACRIQSRSKC